MKYAQGTGRQQLSPFRAVKLFSPKEMSCETYLRDSFSIMVDCRRICTCAKSSEMGKGEKSKAHCKVTGNVRCL